MIEAGQPGAQSALVAAVNWFEQLMLGALGTSIAVIMTAILGVSMLRGRFSPRDGAQVVIGAFVLFGAHSIAVGIIESVVGHATTTVIPTPASPRVPVSPPQFDPYAGVAVPMGH